MASPAEKLRRALGALSGPLLVLALGLGAGCRDAASDRLLIFAAASMHDPMVRIAAAFEREHPEIRVQVHTAGTPALVMQIREGAAADVLITADHHQMQRVRASSRDVAANRLAIVTAPGNPHRIGGMTDLARRDLLVALCAPDVPAGRYAREACRRAGVAVQSVSDEPNVRALLTKVQLGELDAGVLYHTDARKRPGVGSVMIDPNHNVIARYPAAALNDRPLARQFVEYLLSDTARGVFAGEGFLPP